MTAIKSEHWDTVTAPSIPTGWTVDTQLVTSTSGAVSAPNSLAYLVANINAAIVPFATFATLDTNTGNVQVSSTVNLATTTTEQDIYMFARANAVITNANYNAQSYYYIIVTRGLGTGNGLSLLKRVSGTATSLAGPIGALADATNYRLYLSCNGTTITAKCQRLTDYTLMNSSGVFVTDGTGNTAFASVTDSAVTGAGYAGIGFYLAASAGQIVSDDWLLETAPAGVQQQPGAVDTVYPTRVVYGGSN